MSIRFAGSRSLDERRRRRLAGENEEQTPLIPTGAAAVAVFGPSRAVREARSGLSKGVPFRKFISPRLWKHWAIGIVGATLAAMVLFLGFHEEAIAKFGGPNLSDLISLSSGRLATCFNSVALLLAGQVAVVIFWARARSRDDFGGRFKIWIWTFLAWFVMAAVVAMDAHTTFSETVLWVSKASFWQQQTLCWLLPMAALGSVLWIGLDQDMSGCRSSRTMLRLATLLFCSSLIFRLELTRPIATRWSDTLQIGGAMLGCLSLFLSMLLHARHVIYVTSEPPEIRRGGLKKLLAFVRLPRLRRSNVEKVETTIDDAAADSISTDEISETTQDAGNKPIESSGNSNAAESQTVRVDECEPDSVGNPPPKPNLKGLSKRQRREAMKQWREESRLQS